jgi:hypothetical protein
VGHWLSIAIQAAWYIRLTQQDTLFSAEALLQTAQLVAICSWITRKVLLGWVIDICHRIFWGTFVCLLLLLLDLSCIVQVCCRSCMQKGHQDFKPNCEIEEIKVLV